MTDELSKSEPGVPIEASAYEVDASIVLACSRQGAAGPVTPPGPTEGVTDLSR